MTTFTVDGADISSSVLEGSLSVQDRVEERSTCSFAVEDPDGSWSTSEGEAVSIVDEDGVTVFAGRVDAHSFVSPSPVDALRVHEVSCVDNHYLADKRIAARSYEDKAAGFIVADLITEYLAGEGVTAGTIEDGPTIAATIFNYVYVDEALDALAEKSDGFVWSIDSAKALHFRHRASVAAPWEVTSDDALFSPDPLLDTSNPEYRNRQYVRGGRDLTDSQTETRPGDGETQAWAMSYPLAQVPTVSVDSVAKTVGIRGVDEGKDWYWNKGDPVISQDSSATPLASDEVLEVTYVGEFSIIALVEDPEQIADRKAAEGGTGLVEAVVDAPEVSDRGAAFDLGKARLAKYGTVGRSLKFDTRRGGLAAGQMVTVTLPSHGLDGEQFLISDVSTRDEGTRLRHSVTCVQGPVLTSWVRTLAALSRQAAAVVDLINVGGGDVLTLLTSTREQWDWSEDVTVSTAACELLPAEMPFELC